MADIRGVGKQITYSDDNPISQWIEELREKRKAQKREPRNEAERKLLAQARAHLCLLTRGCSAERSPKTPCFRSRRSP